MDLYSKEFEMEILSIIITSPISLDEAKHLQPHHFYFVAHGEIFQALREMESKNIAIDLNAVMMYMNQRHLTELLEISAIFRMPSALPYRCAVIIQMFTARELKTICEQTLMKIASEDADVFDTIQSTISNIDKLSISSGKDFTDLSRATTDLVKYIEDMQQKGIALTGINTGYESWNKITGGFQRGDMIVISARPGKGKTALALNFLNNISSKGTPVGFFSLEMSIHQLATRMMAMKSGVYLNYIKQANLDEYKWGKIMTTNFSNPIIIDETPGLNVLDFRVKAKKMVKLFNVQLIVVDYAQLMTVYNEKNREQQISIITRTVKHTAKELGIPIILLAQMGRDIEKSNRRPRLSDLRESGSLENDADMVAFIHSPDGAEADTETGIMMVEIVVEKNRQGEVGYFDMEFDGKVQRFTDINTNNNNF